MSAWRRFRVCAGAAFLLAGWTACREQAAPVAVDLEPVAREVESLRVQLAEAQAQQLSTRDRLLVTQKALNDLESEYRRHKDATAGLREEARELSRENEQLRRALAQAEAAARPVVSVGSPPQPAAEGAEEASTASSATAGVPAPFVLYDIAYVGDMEFEGKTRGVGRFSVTNTTGAPLRLFANSLFRTIRIEIPAYGASNRIHMAAREGAMLRVNTTNHTETATW